MPLLPKNSLLFKARKRGMRAAIRMIKPTSSAGSNAKMSVALLLAINLFCYLDRYLISAVLPQIKLEFLKGNPHENFWAGMLGTAFLVTYMIAAPIFGVLADRYSRWKLIAFAVALWSLASGASGLAGSFMILILTRVFLGIGEAGFGPAAPTLISDLFPVEKRGQVMSWFYVALPVGSALGFILGGWAAVNLGWRWAFYLVVPPGLLLAAWAFMMKEPKRDTPQKKRRAGLEDYKRLLKIPSYLINVAAQTALTFSIGGIAFWMPNYLNEARGIDLGRATFIFGLIVVVAGLISTLLGGLLADRLRSRFPGSYFLVSGCGMLLGFPFTVAMLYVPFPYAWGVIFLAIFFLFLNTGPANTAIANVTPPAIRASAFALCILVIHALGDVISPPLIGLIRDKASWDLAFIVVSLVILVGGITWISSMKALARDTAAMEREEAERDDYGCGEKKLSA
jgi:MFS family permease